MCRWKDMKIFKNGIVESTYLDCWNVSQVIQGVFFLFWIQSVKFFCTILAWNMNRIFNWNWIRNIIFLKEDFRKSFIAKKFVPSMRCQKAIPKINENAYLTLAKGGRGETDPIFVNGDQGPINPYGPCPDRRTFAQMPSLFERCSSHK